MLIDISTWWSTLVPFEKILWGISLLFSLLFLIQVIITIAGGDTDSYGDSDEYAAEDDGAGYQFFTLKNMVAFFTMFGWVGIASHSGGLARWVVILIAFISGGMMMVMMAFLFRNVSRLKHSGTMQIKNAINQVGETYLFIPASRGGIGKVSIRVQGSLRELQAMTDDDEQIPTGKPVRVTGIINDSILLVTSYIRN
jgi:hypothetical protein